MIQGLTVDGTLYSHIHIASLKREGEVLDGPNAKRSVAGNMIRDVIGTYYNYTAQIESDEANVAEYDTLYEVLSSPMSSHSIVVPYGQTTLTFNAYVTKVSDEIIRINDTKTLWGNMSFKFVAMQPQRR